MVARRRWGLSKGGLGHLCQILSGLGTAMAEAAPALAAGAGIGATGIGIGAVGGAAIALPAIAAGGTGFLWYKAAKEGKEDACKTLFEAQAAALLDNAGADDPTSRYEAEGLAALEGDLVSALCASLPDGQTERLTMLAQRGLNGDAIARALHEAVPETSRFATGEEADLFRAAVAGTWEHLRTTPDFYATLASYVDEEKLRLLGEIDRKVDTVLVGIEEIKAALHTSMERLQLALLAYYRSEERAAFELALQPLAGPLGMTEAKFVRLVLQHAEGGQADVMGTLASIEDTLAREIQRRPPGRSNLTDDIDETLARVFALNNAGEFAAGRQAIDAKLAEAKAGEARLLDEAVEQTRLENDPEGAAGYVLARLDLDAPEDRFEALRALFIEWYERGRDAGLRFDLEVAIALARVSLERAQDAEQRGAAGNDLGIVLGTLGERESGTEKLDEAVTAFRSALLERTRERVPLDWAMSQNNLGNALQTLGERESGAERLEEAVTAYRNALLERTHKRVPLDWAITQNNLGTALQTLGQRESGTERLEEAVTACRSALLERTRERVPLDWAMTQNNLGNALQTLGRRESGTERLEEVVTAYRSALLEWTRERVPLDWALTQNNLGTALQILGEREGGTERLEEAVTAYRSALLERTRERVPLDWATTQHNMSGVKDILADRGAGEGVRREALDHAREALAVFEEAGASYYIEGAQKRVARIDAKMGPGET